MLQIKTAVQILQHKNFLCFPTKDKKNLLVQTCNSSKAWNIFGIENYLANINIFFCKDKKKAKQRMLLQNVI